MIKPVNGHLLIEPVKHETFIASDKTTYQEIGVVLGYSSDLITVGAGLIARPRVEIGQKVYFDSWLAAKYPKNDTEFYWLVKWEDVRAIEHEEVPE